MSKSQIGSVLGAFGTLVMAFSVGGFTGCSASGGSASAPPLGGSIADAGASNADAGAGSGGASGATGSPSDDESGGAGGEGGEGGAAGSTDLAPSCLPSQGADLPDDDFLDSNCDGIDGDAAHAIFVSPSGSDTADGSIKSPVKTIQHGVELAAAAKQNVYVCLGAYSDNIVVGKDAASIFGGYNCEDWSRGNARVKVAPASGSALVIRDAMAPVVVDRFELRSADATNAGESSIAAMMINSAAVTLSSVTITAGAGAEGKPGGTVKSVTSAAATGASGHDAGSQCNYIDGEVVPSPACRQLRAGGQKGAVTCPSGEHVRGGFGGTGGNKTPSNIVLHTAGGTGLPGGKSVNQKPVVGAIGDPGEPASRGFGEATAAGYLPTNIGGEGGFGHAGESGGGGDGGDACRYYDETLADCRTQLWNYGGALFMGAGGGQGGFGGCGGVGGKGGQGGGASIAVFSYGTKLSISRASLTSSSGGRGGAPSPGAAGQPGGVSGTGGGFSPNNFSSSTPAFEEGQDGANGANGGPGGPGGAGGGGPSIVVFAAKSAPTIAGTTLSAGSGGPGGVGIEKRDGAPGESAETKLVDIVDDDAAGAGSQ